MILTSGTLEKQKKLQRENIWSNLLILQVGKLRPREKKRMSNTTKPI